MVTATHLEPSANEHEPAEGAAGRLGAIGAAVSDAAQTVMATAGEAASRLPEVTVATRSAIADADRRLRTGSDEMLTAGIVLSFGFAMGLLVGGAGRVLVAASFVPTAAMGLTMLDRSAAARMPGRRLQGG